MLWSVLVLISFSAIHTKGKNIRTDNSTQRVCKRACRQFLADVNFSRMVYNVLKWSTMFLYGMFFNGLQYSRIFEMV